MITEERQILRRVANASKNAGEMLLALARGATVGQHRAWWAFLAEAREEKVIALLDALAEAEAENKRLKALLEAKRL